MVSQTFSLGTGEGNSGVCTKVLLLLIMGAIVVAAVIIGIFAFRTSKSSEGCTSPKLDPFGLSNFTSGATTIAFGCFPGYFVDEISPEERNVFLSQCVDHKWIPEPPTCNFVPIRLDCNVTNHGLEGSISMIQMGRHNSTTIFGKVKYGKAIKDEGHINEVIPLSRQQPHCQISQDYNVTQGNPESTEDEDDPYVLDIHFESKDLAAYREAQIHINMIFLDVNTTATIISCHQGSYTMVMPKSLPKLTA